ncbi:hypothetical protein [Nocardia iowensis]|uniref:DUF4241 domain-containing protein n=1 Tax=Nocardia iowensis TaxID=204891 RepID=A0ABX8RYA2_NOCIO|nr:hypothetical protein [Nocardia iowensis]QXN94628.1 hypothetical protein KV110_17185 [Nocardia iowensis]
MSTADGFYALSAGHAPRIGAPPDAANCARLAALTVRPLGRLTVLSGRLAAGDLASLGTQHVGPTPGRAGAGEIPVFGPIPVGAHPLRLTLAATLEHTHLIPAYLSMVFIDTPTDTIEPWIAEGGQSHNGAPADNFVSTDNDIVAMLDADVAERALDDPETLQRYRIGDRRIVTALNLSPPFTDSGENLILCRSGTGGGAYPVIASRDAEGNLTGLHIDFAIVGPVDRKQWWKGRHSH